MNAMQIRAYRQIDTDQIADLFHGAVHSISRVLYDSAQKEAWAPTPPDYVEWQARLSEKKPLVAVQNNRVVGFLELEKGENKGSNQGHIDCFYVHKDHQGEGVGKALLMTAIKRARELKYAAIIVEASKVARPVFEMAGFRYKRANKVALRGQILENYSMMLPLK